MLDNRDIEAAYPDREWQKGRPYARRGGARLEKVVDVAAGHVRLSGRVQGTRTQPYTPRVDIHRSQNGGLEVLATCSCPVGVMCKHGGALLYEAMVRQGRDLAAQLDGVPAMAVPGRPAANEKPPAARPTRAETRSTPKSPQSKSSGPMLSQPWRVTLNRLDKVAGPDTGGAPARRCLIYQLNRLTVESRACLHIAPYAVAVGKDGTLHAAETPYSYDTVRQRPAKFVTRGDVTILAALGQTGGITHGTAWAQGHGYVLWDPPEATTAALLQRVVATGRAYWGDHQHNRPLREGGARRANVQWRMDGEGGQHFTLAGETGTEIPLPVTPPHYVDPESGAFGPLETDVPAHVAGVLLQAPPLDPDDAAAFRREAETRLGDSLPVWPTVAAHSATRELTPVPVLRLFTARRRVAASIWRPPGTAPDTPEAVAAAGLWFDYGGHTLPVDAAQDTLKLLEDDTLVHVPRDGVAEQASAARIAGCGLWPLRLDWTDAQRLGVGEAFFAMEGEQALDVQHWLEFLDTTVPRLKADGWRIEIAADFPYTVRRPDGECRIDLDTASDIDWFSVGLGIQVDGEDVDLLPVIRTILNTPHLIDAANAPPPDEDVYVPLGDGRYVAMNGARLAGIARTLQGLLEPGDDPKRSRIPAARLGDLAMLAPDGSADLRITGGERLRELARALSDPDAAGGDERPARLQGELRGYQAQGLRWLQVLARHGFGGILADDMGLGKTIQALAHILLEKEAGRLDAPCLIVAPTSVVPTWVAEARRFAPDLDTVAVQGKARADRHAAADTADLVVTSYALLRQDRTRFAGRGYAIVICDEAQALKNPKSQAAAILRELSARQVVCLTGTPLENSLEDLWSLMRLTVPGALGERKAFRQTFRTPIEHHGDSQRREQLSRRVRPFLLRRRKADVAVDLPARTEIQDSVVLSGAQRDLYETVRASMDARVREAIRTHGVNRSQITVLEALLKLRQVCCDPRLLDAESARRAGQSAKLERLRALLADLRAEARRVLVFSQFTSMLDLIEPALQAADMPYVRLDGSTTDRETPVRRFQDGEVPVFLVSLKAGGTGLNLTAADTVIHYDPWWNPAVSAQATDRAHRIGQDKPIFVYHLIAEGTVEARMRELQAQKRDLAQFIETDGTQGGGLDEADVDLLLAPIGV